LVPQDLALYDELSARANLQLFGSLYGLSAKALDDSISRTLALVGLADRAHDKVKTLTLAVPIAIASFLMLVFGVRIEGNITGFALVALACSIMAATFGLLVSALGRTAAATRRVATLAVLIMVMLGGAWVPSFIFPAWLQTVTVVIPARWAVDGLDAMTWRGLGLQAALMPTFVMLLFSVIFGALTLWRFRWEEA
jgi:ABC-2 type transport system permease protein